MRKRRTAVPAAALLALGVAAPAVGQGDTDIHLLGIEVSAGRVTVVQAPRAVTDRPGYDNQPAFTADGRAILFTSIRGDQADTYRYDISTGRETRVTRTSVESEYSPTPIPGTERFSVVRVEADSTQRLWSFAADGSAPALVLPRVAPVGYHAWATPDRVALFVLGDPPTLQLATVGPGGADTVARGIGRALQPVPGRNAVSFVQEMDGGWWLRELDVESGRVRSLAPLPSGDEYHAWTPGGAVLTARESRLYQWSPSGRRWEQVADLARFGLSGLSRLAVSPDGRRLAVVADRPQEADAAAAGVGGGVPAGDGTLVAFASVVLGSLLAMINPLGALTIFVGLTADQSAGQRRRTALRACITAGVILMVFALFGTAILRFFGITTYAFRIAGGILFFAIGWDMLQARRSRSKTTPEEEVESASRADVAVVPLGMPTLAGPGAITTVIALMGQTATPFEAGVVYIGAGVVLLLSFLVLWAGPMILRFLGQTGINVVTRLMGLLVMVVGVQFVLDGLRTVVVEVLGTLA